MIRPSSLADDGLCTSVRSNEKNLPLYHLAFFSKHPRGYEFWNQVLKYGTDQLSLFE